MLFKSYVKKSSSWTYYSGIAIHTLAPQKVNLHLVFYIQKKKKKNISRMNDEMSNKPRMWRLTFHEQNKSLQKVCK